MTNIMITSGSSNDLELFYIYIRIIRKIGNTLFKTQKRDKILNITNYNKRDHNMFSYFRVFNRPGVSRAVLQSPPLLFN